VTRADLGTFAHLHPSPAGEPGVFEVPVTFPTAGAYALHAEVRQQGQLADVLDETTVTVPGTAPAPVPVPAADVRSVSVDGATIELEGEARVGETSDLTLRTPSGLQPYLGAAGHVVVMRADGADFQHRHAETFDDRGRPVPALPGTTFGPELALHVRFDDAAAYRLWVQVRLADGSVATAPFVVHAR
jgi:Cu+-exporting ATPase